MHYGIVKHEQWESVARVGAMCAKSHQLISYGVSHSLICCSEVKTTMR